MRDTTRSLFNPIETIEEIMTAQELPFHRMSTSEIVTELDGRWGAYRLQFFWQEEVGALHLSIIFDLSMVDVEKSEIYELLALLNERMILGHFEVFPQENSPAFRYSYLIAQGQNISLEVMEEVMDVCLDECERCYPAFQYLQSGEKSAYEAASIAVMDTAGEA